MKNNIAILQVGDPVLREKAARVDIVDYALLDAMADAMFAAKGAGLAAPQVGVSQRVIVMRPDRGIEVLKMINPELSEFSDDKISMEEGCLSVLGPDGPVYAHLTRPESVRVKWTDENGILHDEIFDGFKARVIQHEFDHLEGVLFIDRVSSLKRAMIMSKVKKAAAS
ncbi:MAG: peptide deformylase [Alphaproteobacteria bacterium]|nr:peptide deformylase [Alphaproteobacteria bacterium]